MAQLLLTRNSHIQHALRNRALSAAPMRFGKFFIMFIMTFLIGLLSFFYLVKFTEIHTKGNQLRRLEIERDRLLTAREGSSVKISNERALHAIKESAVNHNMVPARNAFFVKQDGAVAVGTLPNQF